MRTIGVVVALVAAASSTVSAQEGAESAALRVRDAWARPAMTGRPMSAAYFVVENPGAAPVTLTGIVCDVAAAAELHESYEENGMMRMRPVPSLPVPAGGRVALRPGGYHVMLMGLRRALAPGDRVRCELRAAGTVVARFEAEIRAQ